MFVFFLLMRSKAYHTGIHLPHLHNLFDHHTAKHWKCSSHSDKQSGPPHTFAHVKLGQNKTKSFHISKGFSIISFLIETNVLDLSLKAQSKCF